MLTEIKSILQSKLPKLLIEGKGKDVLVKSGDRELAYDLLKKEFKRKRIKFKDVFKKSKSSSLNVLEIENYGDIIFKPIIQKGAGGVKFEHQLEEDLNQWFQGQSINRLKHKDVVSRLKTVVNLRQLKRDSEIIPEGSKNKRREISYPPFRVNNTDGATLSDLTVKQKGKPFYFSLKIGKSYYTLNAGVERFFSDKQKQKSINEFFGFDGQQMGGFGREYFVITKKPNYAQVARNLANVLQQGHGKDVIIVHKKSENDVLVKKVNGFPQVTISELNKDSYKYPVKGVRKYANIAVKAKINQKDYKIDFQFRGTTATDKGPRYLRLLMERLN